MKLKNILFILLIPVLFVLFSGCNGPVASDNPEKDILGVWESVDQSIVLQFTSDNKIHAKIKNGSFIIDNNSEVRFIDKTKILGTWEMDFPVYEISVYENTFILNDEEGKKSIFNRIK